MAPHDPPPAGQADDNAGVWFYPPMAVMAALVVCTGLASISPFPIAESSALRYVIGAVLAISGGWLMRYCIGYFKRAENMIPPNKPINQLIDTGIYGHSRNPMYVGMMLAMAGITLLMNNSWLLLGSFAVWTYLQLHVIPREEAYLARRFGDVYHQYRQRVARWFQLRPPA